MDQPPQARTALVMGIDLIVAKIKIFPIIDEMLIDWLKDCQAWCCRKDKRWLMVFDFTPAEAMRLKELGMKLSRTQAKGGGYLMLEDCVVLEGNRCRWHESELQPECCRVNIAGGEKMCMQIRDYVLRGIRHSEVE